MQVYVADYTADVQHLTCEQDGAYWRLLRAMWRAGGSLPNQPQKLANICGLSLSRWTKIAPDVMDLFRSENGEITQKRLSAEIEKAKKKSEKRSEAGKKSAETKSLKNNDTASTHVDDLLKHSLEPEPELEIEEGIPNGILVDLPDEPRLAFEAYNMMARSVKAPVARDFTDKRKKVLRARLSEIGGLSNWARIMDQIAASPFLTGQTTSFQVSFDWATKAENFRKITEGNYDGRTPHRSGSDHQRKLENMLAGAMAFVDEGRRWDGFGEGDFGQSGSA